MSPRSTLSLVVTAALGLALSACGGENTTPEPDPTATPTETGQPVSILRPDVEEETPVALIEPLEVTIGFPEGGSELNANAVTALEGVLASQLIARDLPIVLGAHSDSAGTDSANERASEERGLAVARWLIENGVDEDRIRVIAFGEQNPVEPNALPDGSPNEAGRAANRRVEIAIAVPDATGAEPQADEASEDEG